MYRYEAIAPRQIYEGVIRCESESSADLMVKALSDESIYVGGSRGSGYGKCKVLNIHRTSAHGELTRFGLTRQTDSQVLTIYALSNLILLNENGQETAEIDPAFLEQQLGISNVRLLRSSVRVHRTAGYNHIWRAGQVQRSAVAAGSIYYYTYNGMIQADRAAALEDKGIGLRLQDGYGSILVAPDWRGDNTDSILLQNASVDRFSPAQVNLSDEDQNTLRFIEDRINQYRADVLLRESALEFNKRYADSLRRISMTQTTRLYSLIGQILDSDVGDKTVAVERVHSFTADLKDKSRTMYQSAQIEIGGQNISMLDYINQMVCGDAYTLRDLTGNSEQADYITLSSGVTHSEQDVLYDKLRFLYLVLYGRMRGETA